MKSAAQSKKGSGDDQSAEGVGGRQEDRSSATEGGGSLNFYKKNSRAGLGEERDPRLDELRQVGLSNAWLTVAEVIGVDAFLAVWKVLDYQADQINPVQRELYVPTFTSYLRFQRNRFIIALASQGTREPEIKRIVRESLCEDISERHITRIIARFKIVDDDNG